MTTKLCMLCYRRLPKKLMSHIWGGDYVCDSEKDERNGLQCNNIEDAIFFFKLDGLQANSKDITDCDL